MSVAAVNLAAQMDAAAVASPGPWAQSPAAANTPGGDVFGEVRGTGSELFIVCQIAFDAQIAPALPL